MPRVSPNMLNTMQRFACDLVEMYKTKKEQLLIIINGTAGTGKSYLISSISITIATQKRDAYYHRRIFYGVASTTCTDRL